VGDLCRWGRADLRQLVVEPRPATPWRRRQEVRHVAAERSTARSGARSSRRARSRTSRCQGSWYERARSSTNVRSAASVSQTGEQANRTANKSSRARNANTVTSQGRYTQERIIRAAVESVPILRPMNTEPARRSGYRAALASGEFRALLAAQLVSVGGMSIAAVALTILVYRRTESPLLASPAFALGFLPYLLGGGLLSSIVDRMRPRQLVACCDFASALLAAAIAWPAIPVPLLLALLLAIGTLASVSSGARAALARSTVAEDAYAPRVRSCGSPPSLRRSAAMRAVARSSSFSLRAARCSSTRVHSPARPPPCASPSPTTRTSPTGAGTRSCGTRCEACAASSLTPSCDACCSWDGWLPCSSSHPRRSPPRTSPPTTAPQPSWACGSSPSPLASTAGTLPACDF
jgi:hypothetical protein